MRKFFIMLCLLIALVPSARAENETVDATGAVYSYYPDRRKEQFETSFAYAAFPLPCALPGIGKGLSLVGGAMKIVNTYTVHTASYTAATWRGWPLA